MRSNIKAVASGNLTATSRLNLSFELERFHVFAVQALVHCFRCFVTATQNEALHAMVAHGYQIVADVLDVRFDLIERINGAQ